MDAEYDVEPDVEPDEPTIAPWRGRFARQNILLLFVAGVAAAIIGGMLIGVGDSIGAGPVIAGLLVGAAGYVLTAVAIIAWGVMLGVRAARD